MRDSAPDGATTNLALEYPSRGQFAFYDLGEPPTPKAGEVLIRTRYSGITNGTERHALLGEHGWEGAFPGRHGYQQVGVIEAAGREVRGFAEGDWVFCGRYIGHRAWQVVEVGEADPYANDSHLVIPLPEGVDRRECALLGVAGVAMRGVRRFGALPGSKVWVAGGGLIGQFAAQAAAAMGAEVTISDLIPLRLQAARAAGLTRVLEAGDSDTMAALREGGPYGVIVDACGAPSLFLDIHRHNLLAPRGVIGALAVRSETTFHWATLHGREASIQVSCHFSLDDLKAVLAFMHQGSLRVAPLVTHRVPISEAPAIYETLRDRPQELLGVVFDWS